MNKDKLGYKNSILNGHKTFNSPTYNWLYIGTTIIPDRTHLRCTLLRYQNKFKPKSMGNEKN